jgi:hypothetical protein
MAKATQYLVLHGGVGQFGQGSLIDSSLEEVQNYQWDRLLAKGAIREATADEIKAATAEQGGVAQSEAMAAVTKQPVVGPSAPELSTGQPGGAPLADDSGKGGK